MSPKKQDLDFSQATDAELRRMIRSARTRARSETKITSASYDARSSEIRVKLSTGASLSVPKQAILGFAKAPPRALANLEIMPGGAGLWSELADDGVLLEQLLVILPALRRLDQSEHESTPERKQPLAPQHLAKTGLRADVH